MGRKSKARSDENAKASKKVKVSEEEVNDDDGPWDGIRVIVDHVICRSDACGQKATAAWVSQKTGDEWAMCNDCQLRDFGECYTGEPLLDNKAPEALEQGEEPDEKQITPKKNDYSRMVGDKTSVTAEEGNSSESPELPIDQPPTVSDDSSPSESPSVASLETMQEEVDTDVPAGPAVTQTQEETPSLPESEGTDGQYDLKKILSLEDLQKDDTICCSQENCDLSAFGLYVNSCHPKDRWYYCLDCQENDFDGWPPVEELPVNYMEPKHIRVMALKCSSRKNPRMPVFSSSSPEGKVEPIANFVTPPPPSKENTLLLNTKEIGPPPKVAGKAKAIEVHKKWLEAAQAMGGKDARIVVSKPAAKKMIFDFLYDSFQPMNITQIFQVRCVIILSCGSSHSVSHTCSTAGTPCSRSTACIEYMSPRNGSRQF